MNWFWPMLVALMKWRWTCPWMNKLEVLKSGSRGMTPWHVRCARPRGWLCCCVLFIPYSPWTWGPAHPAVGGWLLLLKMFFPSSFTPLGVRGGVLRQEKRGWRFYPRWGERAPCLIPGSCSLHLDFKELKCLGKHFRSASSSQPLSSLHRRLFRFPTAA